MVQTISKSEVTPDGEHHEIVLERDNAPSVRFQGLRLAIVSTAAVRRGIGAFRTSSGAHGVAAGPSRWHEYRIYVAYLDDDKKKYVAEKIGHSSVVGEKTLREVLVFKNGAELARGLGATAEWKDVYRDAGIDIAEDLRQ